MVLKHINIDIGMFYETSTHSLLTELVIIKKEIAFSYPFLFSFSPYVVIVVLRTFRFVTFLNSVLFLLYSLKLFKIYIKKSNNNNKFVVQKHKI